MAAGTYIKKIMFKTAVCQIFPWNLEVWSTWEYVCHKTFKHALLSLVFTLKSQVEGKISVTAHFQK